MKTLNANGTVKTIGKPVDTLNYLEEMEKILVEVNSRQDLLFNAEKKDLKELIEQVRTFWRTSTGPNKNFTIDKLNSFYMNYKYRKENVEEFETLKKFMGEN